MTATGVSTGCYHGLDIVTEDAIDRIAAEGVTSLELFIQGESELTGVVVADLTGRVESHSIKVVSLHPYPFGWEHLLFGPYTRQRNWSWDLFRGYLDVGSAVGADAYVSHGPPAHVVRAADGQLAEAYIETSVRLVAAAAERGMRFCLENVSYGLVSSPDDFREHQRQIPGLGFVLDVKSAWKSGHRPADFAANDLVGDIHHSQISFREKGRYGLPATDEASALRDGQLREILALRMPHILEIEADAPGDIGRSLAAIRAGMPA